MNKQLIQYCTRQHKAGKERIISVCMNQHCSIRLVCSYCYQDYHLDHVKDIIPIKEIEIKALNIHNEQRHFEFISLLEEKAKIFQKQKEIFNGLLQKLEEEFNQDCDTLIQAFVYMQNTLLKLTHFHEHSIKEEDLMTVVNNYTNQEYHSIKSAILTQLNKPIESLIKLEEQVSKECRSLQKKKLLTSFIEDKQTLNFYVTNFVQYQNAPKKYTLIRGTMLTNETMVIEEKKKYYYGEIHKGIPYGQGIQIDIEDKKIEEGVWIDGHLAWGQRSTKLGGVLSIVCGEMIDGVVNGLGKMTCMDGDLYNGEWVNGQKHGMGIYKYSNGDFYKGQFKFDLKDGHGLYKAHNGDAYEGEFEKGLKKGDGKYISKNGDHYIGKFKDDKIDGDGIYKFHDGKIQQGCHKNGHPIGIHTIHKGDLHHPFSQITYDDDGKIIETKTYCGRLTADIYVESLCPYCMMFIKDSLYNAITTPEIEKMVHIRLIPYGNTKRTQKDGKWVYTCQHGEAECYGDLIELCAQDRIVKAKGSESDQAGVVHCIENNINRPYTNSTFDQAATYCQSFYPYDAVDVISCASNSEGELLHLIAAEETDNLIPKHLGVPWAVGNKKYTEESGDEIISNLLRWACVNFEGEKIPACYTQ